MKDRYQIRLARRQDIEEVVQLHEVVMGEGDWARNLMDGTHPATNHTNFTVAVDSATDRVVSSMCYIPQQWNYGEVGFSCARVELVSTLSEHRNRGLIRRQFDYLHAICEEKKILVTAVAGISWFYRKFGYDMSLRYFNRYVVSLSQMISQYACDGAAYGMEPASADDLYFYMGLQAVCRKRYRVTCDAPLEFWKQLYCDETVEKLKLHIVKDKERRPVGAIAIPPGAGENVLDVLFCELTAGVSWLDALPCILLYLKNIYPEPVEYLRFVMAPGHPLYAFTQEAAAHQPIGEAPLAWYLRIADYGAFIQQIAPYFEEKLKNSIVAGYSGAIKLSFYKGGLSLFFLDGKLSRVEAGIPAQPNAFLPEELFKQLLFGYKSLPELLAYSAEVNVSGGARVVLDTLFPKQESSFISVQ